MTTVCAWCKKVLKWGPNSTKDFALGLISHGICVDCERKHFKDVVGRKEKENENVQAKS